MKKIICWWIGHIPDRNRNAVPCKRCGLYDIPYHELVEGSRYAKIKLFFKEDIPYWCFRKWFPGKCPDCGGNRKHCDLMDDDHLPF